MINYTNEFLRESCFCLIKAHSNIGTLSALYVTRRRHEMQTCESVIGHQSHEITVKNTIICCHFYFLQTLIFGTARSKLMFLLISQKKLQHFKQKILRGQFSTVTIFMYVMISYLLPYGDREQNGKRENKGSQYMEF